MSASPDFMQGLLGSLAPWMTGSNPSVLDKGAAQYGGFSGLLSALMQGAGPNTSQARTGAALAQAQDNAFQQAGARQKLVEGNLGLARQKMMLDAAQQALQGDRPQGAGLLGAQPPTAGAAPPGASGAAPPSGAPSAGPMSPPPTAAPQSGAPSMSQIYGTTFPGGTSPAYTRAMAMFSQDPAAALLKARDDQLKMAQQYYAPQISQLENIAQSDAPTRYVRANPQLQATWQRMAPQLGFDPQKDFNDANVRTAFAFASNGLKASLSQPTSAPPVQLQNRGLQQVDPRTGKVEREEELEKVIGPDGKPTLVPRSRAAGMTPYSPFTASSAEMDGPVGALDAALTTAGVNLPGGRGGQQRIATLTNLIRANPGMAPQDIADKVRTGQLDFNGAKRSTGQLSTLSAAADVQSRKIEKDLASLGPLVQNLPGGPAKVTNWLTRLNADWSWNGDKESTQAIGYIKEIAGEYAKLVSGSTGQAAPAEGEMKSALGLMQSALSKNGYQGMHDFLTQTSQNRREAVREGLQDASRPGYATGRGSTDAHPQDIQDLLKKYGH